MTDEWIDARAIRGKDMTGVGRAVCLFGSRFGRFWFRIRHRGLCAWERIGVTVMMMRCLWCALNACERID